MPPGASPKTALDAAQKIVAELHGVPSEDQLLALKFAAETLRVDMTSLSRLAAHPISNAVAQSTILEPPHLDGDGHATNIKSFTGQKSPKSDQQFAAVVAYFYQFRAPPSQRKDAIDAETMKHAARLAGRRQVPNWRFTLLNAANAGFLNAAGGGKYKLSPVGENLVAITLPGNAVAAGGKQPKDRSAKKEKRVTKAKAKV